MAGLLCARLMSHHEHSAVLRFRPPLVRGTYRSDRSMPDEPRTFGLAQLSVGHGGPQDPRLFVKDSEGELICVFPQNFPLEHLPSVLLMIDQALFKGLAWARRKEKARAIKQLLWT
jgi:hypothetical protein